LIVAYDKIVKPMERNLKSIMIENLIANEAELFCSDFSFKLNEEEGSKFIGDPGKKTESIISAIVLKIEEIKRRY